MRQQIEQVNLMTRGLDGNTTDWRNYEKFAFTYDIKKNEITVAKCCYGVHNN